MRRFGLPIETISDNPLPDVIIGYISVRGHETVFEGATTLHSSAGAYDATTADRNSVRRNLQSEGFEILAESPLGLSVAGPAEAFSNLTAGQIIAKEILIQDAGGYHVYKTHLDIVGENQPESLGVATVKSPNAKIDGLILERPRIPHAVFPSPSPPNINTSKFYLSVPTDVASILNAVGAHRNGETGTGITVAMPDTGFYRHPFFSALNYNILTPIAMVPGTNRSKDPIGHGTGEAANIFALAPGCVLQPIRISNDQGDLVGSISGFLKAKEINPRIITSSWGGDNDYPPSGPPDQSELAFAAEIRDAIRRKILVIFSAGNGQFSVEPQVPGVLAAGGVFVDQDGNLRASDYASGYASPWFDNIIVPTVCGLVGLQPRAQYLLLPVPPGCEIDRDEAATADGDPTTDGTASDDGWALFSGTSAAAPQLAGAAALLLGAKPNMTPEQVIEALSRTAVDVTVGRSFPQRFNEPAEKGHDKATGAGLIDVSAALQYSENHF